MSINISRTIVLPIDEKEYKNIITSRLQYRKKVDALIEQHPEIFPVHITQGYSFSGMSVNSQKSATPRRIIRIQHPTNTYDDYLLHPCYEMPYMRGKTVEVSEGLYLRKHNTPHHAIAYLNGRNAMYWYRAESALARYNIVGTTIKRAEHLPTDVLIDEHHSRLGRRKLYVCTTVGNNCFLGASVSTSIDYEHLVQSYGVFKDELLSILPDYTIQSINTDGFRSTCKTAEFLFPKAQILRCFLHGFIKIKSCGTKAYDLYFNIIADKVWDCYRADDKFIFAQRIRRLKEWTQTHVPQSPFKTAVLKLCEKKRIYGLLRRAIRTQNF